MTPYELSEALPIQKDMNEFKRRQALNQAETSPVEHDPINHPKHYTSHPSGIECIQITRHMSFNLGNAIKYLWRANDKGNTIEDLEKAKWYIQDEINKLKQEKTN